LPAWPRPVRCGLTPDAMRLNPARSAAQFDQLRRPAAASRTCSSCAACLPYPLPQRPGVHRQGRRRGPMLMCTPHRRVQPNRPLAPVSSALLCSCARPKVPDSSRSRLLPRSPVRMGGSDGIVDRDRDPVFDPAEGRPFQYPL